MARQESPQPETPDQKAARVAAAAKRQLGAKLRIFRRTGRERGLEIRQQRNRRGAR